MPYKAISNHPDCPGSKPWGVVVEADGRLIACHPTKERAEAQITAINISEAGKNGVEKQEPPTETKLDRLDRLARQRSLARSIREIGAVLDNSDGWRRLRGISDEEWQRAEREDIEGATTLGG